MFEHAYAYRIDVYQAIVGGRGGHLYGTTLGGGIFGGGAAFKLVPDATGTVWTETVIASFCPQGFCLDGAYPSALVMDAAGNLFGTTSDGSLGGGGAWRLWPGRGIEA